MKCPLCSSNETETFEVNHPFIRHLDFTDMYDKGRLGQCRSCYLVFNVISERSEKELQSYYTSLAYAKSRQTKHTVTVTEFAKPVTRSFLQAEMIRDFFSIEKPKILDIGCFDGELLKELESRFPDGDYHGFDINPYLEGLFFKGNRFHFWFSDLSRIDEIFDLICLSHSLAYIQDLNALSVQLDRLLKADGTLFVQTANLEANPCIALFADQRYLFSHKILCNLFAHLGFTLTTVHSDWFPREIVGTGKKRLRMKAKPFRTDLHLAESLTDLESMAVRIQEVKQEGNIGVLGTTVNAAFTHGILGDRTGFFVEENPYKTQVSFRGREVVHPAKLHNNDMVILPYGKTAAKIALRFEAQYPGRFVPV